MDCTINNALRNINTFREYFPDSFDMVTIPNDTDFDTIDQLIEIPRVKKVMGLEGFSKLSKSGTFLMAEFDEGKRWYIIGYLRYPDWVDLPYWDERKV